MILNDRRHVAMKVLENILLLVGLIRALERAQTPLHQKAPRDDTSLTSLYVATLQLFTEETRQSVVALL